MKSLETSDLILSAGPDDAPPHTAAKRPWHTRAGALVSAGVGAFFFYFFVKMGGFPPNAVSLNGIASLLPLLIAPCALGAAVGLVLRRAWAFRLLALTGILLLALFATGALYALMLLTAPTTRADAVRLTNALLVMLIALLPALCIGLVYAAVGRAGPRFARVAIPLAFLLLAILIWFFSRLV